ncbi:MAG: hypothetical protein AB3N28_01795 [Kordiimonas sp.]
MILFHWLNNWYNENGSIELPPLPLFDGKTPDELLPPDPNSAEREGEGEGTIAPGEPIPVEPDGGIGDGAKPLPSDPDPIPVEPDGGIGDGAGPIPDVFTNTIEGEGEGTEGNDHFLATDAAETFAFESGQGNDAISGFDLSQDTLDLSGTEFTNVKDVIAASADAGTLDFVVATFKDLDEGVLMKTGDGAYAYLEGVTVGDLESMNMLFAN